MEYSGPEDDHFRHWQVEFHNIPQVTWEFLDPKLPILRVTAHVEQRLPLTDPASPEPSKPSEATSREQRASSERKHNITRYSVSFVMSLQNRWTSFDDPDRWILRFGEDLELYLVSPHHVDRSREDPDYMPNYWKGDEMGQSSYERFKELRGQLGHTQDTGLIYPDYWDDTDYMQHQIIGPAVLTVHESPVLQPGTYSMIPRISQWEAPGHILTEEQIQEIFVKYTISEHLFQFQDEKKILRVWPFTFHPNTGFPLPGHVMVTPQFGPGTETWKKWGMESWEEYDRSLSEK